MLLIDEKATKDLRMLFQLYNSTCDYYLTSVYSLKLLVKRTDIVQLNTCSEHFSQCRICNYFANLTY